jgi:hypothetical protein
MLTRNEKTGLVLAALLGLADIALLAALGGDSAEKPPVWIVALSVLVGLATLVLVAMAWRRPTWPIMVTIIGLRALSALGDLPGLTQDAVIATISAVHLAVSVICLVLLRRWFRRPTEAGRERTQAGAVG